MPDEPRHVLFLAESAPSRSHGNGIVAATVLRGLPASRLLGFFDQRSAAPSPEYADRFHDLGPWRTPRLFRAVNHLSLGLAAEPLRRLLPDAAIRHDLAFVNNRIRQSGFTPGVVYFSGMSYRYLRLAVMAAEQYDLPMVILQMNDWMEVERQQAGLWGSGWRRRIVAQMTRAAARSLASTASSPRLAAKVGAMTGYRHAPANNCCADLLTGAPNAEPPRPAVPVITYAGTMDPTFQGETLRVLASAVTELNAEGTRVHLHIYTPWEFAPDANAIAVPDAVYYKGQLGRTQLAGVYRTSDFLVTTVTCREQDVALLRHSLSTKLSEYLCAGRPVISMGHPDWHLHEYVQDHGCGFSILMDERFARSRVKEELRRILATDRRSLEAIGRRNRDLWERAHDVERVARSTRRALGLPTFVEAQRLRRGVLWVGGSADGWVPAIKVNAIARQLVDVFEHSAVDILSDPSESPLSHAGLEEILRYCNDIGLPPTLCVDARIIDVARISQLQQICKVDVLVNVDAPDARTGTILELAIDALQMAGINVSILQSAQPLLANAHQSAVRPSSAATYMPYGWEPAGTRWSLSAAQRTADVSMVLPQDVFEQVETLRREFACPEVFAGIRRIDTVRPDAAHPVDPVQRVINQLSLRVSPSGPNRPVLWLFGSAETGVEVIGALERHPWLWTAVDFGGFLSSPDGCSGDTLYGYPWRSINDISLHPDDLIIVTSKTARLAIQQEVSRRGWLDRMVPMFGLGSMSHRYERLLEDAGITGRADATGWTGAMDATDADAAYCATLELIERCPAGEIGGGLLAHLVDQAWIAGQAPVPAVLPTGSIRAA